MTAKSDQLLCERVKWEGCVEDLQAENKRLREELAQAKRDYKSANDRVVQLLSLRTGEKLNAEQRRVEEIEQLRKEGFHVQKITRYQWRIATLHIFTGTGRWENTATGERGRLRAWTFKRRTDKTSTSIRELVEAQLPKGASA